MDPISSVEFCRRWLRTVREDAHKRLLKVARVFENVFGNRTDRRVAERGGGEVPAPVTLLRRPAFVVRTAIAFDDQPSIDNEVDTTDPADRHLNLDVSTHGPEQESHQTFGPGLASAIEQRPQHAVPLREKPEHLCDSILINESRVPRTVERRDRIARGLATTRLRKSLDRVGSEMAAFAP